MYNNVKCGASTLNHMKVIPMSQINQEVVANLGPKIGAIWVAIGVSSWSEAAGFLAFILSFLALSEWVWKKVARPTLVHFKIMQPAKRKIKLVEVEDDE